MLAAVLASTLFALAPLAASLRPSALPPARPRMTVSEWGPWLPPTPAAPLAPLPPEQRRPRPAAPRPHPGIALAYWAADAPMSTMLATLGWESA